jgi:hypothetical protein
MEEYKIIKTLESLKAGKPDKSWADFSKQDILSKTFDDNVVQGESVYSRIREYLTFSRLAFAASFSVLIIATFVMLNPSMPGQVYNTAHKPTPEEKLLAAIRSTELELSRIPSSNNGEEVDVKEVENGARRALASASEQLKNLPDNQKAAFAGTVVSKVKALEKNTNAVIMDEDKTAIQEFYKVIADNEIKEIEKNIDNLTDEQKVILSKAKDFFAVEHYSEALEEVYKIQPEADNGTDKSDKD